MGIQKNVFLDAFANGTSYGLKEAAEIVKVMQKGAPTNSVRVKEFEKKFAEFTGAGYGVAANSWVGAAQLLAILMEFKPGDEVIVPALTFQASANIFQKEGARIVFADCDKRTFHIDPQKLEEAVTERTRAVVVVHMCGQPCDMEPITRIAEKHGLMVIQDAAHAPGAVYHGKRLGELSDFAIYSFHQSKNMSTLGEGGMIVTNRRDWAEKMRKLREHGGGVYLGVSSRMTEVQAAAGIVQLERLPGYNQERRKRAYSLNEKLKGMDGISVPYEMEHVSHTYHLYNITIDPRKLQITRDEIIRRMWVKNRVMAAAQYDPAVHLLPAYQKLGYRKGECPIAEETSARILTLPLSFRFKEEEIDQIAEALKAAVN